ncbi:MAG: hypothetical protein IPG17_00135 [Sandaracinaceae bacterium]|nr:hypothetical protein [Sandaracinaceae bacterium]
MSRSTSSPLGVTVPVVHGLEVVEVQQCQRAGRALTRGAHRSLEHGTKGAPVGQAGQHVVSGQVHELGLGAATLLDFVLQARVGLGQRAPLRLDQHALVRAPARGAVGVQRQAHAQGGGRQAVHRDGEPLRHVVLQQRAAHQHGHESQRIAD